MSTSCACAYATPYWAYMERIYHPNGNETLSFYVTSQRINFGIWLGSDEEFLLLIKDINNSCQLQWTSERLNTSVNFLNLTIYISKNGNICTKTYQKPTNLHLYILPNSTRPPGVLKSLIYGNLRRYWLQNTHIKDFISIAKQFASCLIIRGYNKDTIKNNFLEASKKLNSILSTNVCHWCQCLPGKSSKFAEAYKKRTQK